MTDDYETDDEIVCVHDRAKSYHTACPECDADLEALDDDGPEGARDDG